MIFVDQLLVGTGQRESLRFKGEFFFLKFRLDGAGVHTGTALDAVIIGQDQLALIIEV